MAYAFRAAGTAATGNSTSTGTVALPAGVAAGDLLIAVLAVSTGGSSSTAPTISAPSGWTADVNTPYIHQTTSAGSDLAIYYRWATGSDTGPSWTLNGAAFNFKYAARVFAWSGGPGSGTPAVTFGNGPSGTTSTSSTTSTDTASSQWYVEAYSLRSSTNTSYTTPAGTTLRGSQFGSGGAAADLLVVDSNGTASGTVGGDTTTAGTGGSWGTNALIVFPASSFATAGSGALTLTGSATVTGPTFAATGSGAVSLTGIAVPTNTATTGSATISLTGACTAGIYWFNDANDGTNGASLASGTGNSADGSALFGTVTGVGGTLVYDNTHALDGSLSYLATSDASGHSTRGIWDNTQVQISTPQYVSELLYLPALPSGSTVVGGVFTAGSGLIMDAVITSAGKVQLLGVGGVSAGVSTTTVPVGSPFRLEFALLVSSATVGQVEARIFTNPSDVTPAETFTSPATVNTLGTPGQVATGGSVASATASYSYWFDQFRTSPTGYPPPPPASAGGAAQVTLTGAATGTVSFATTGTAALTLTAAATDALKFLVTASAALTLTAAATAALKFVTTGSGALTLTGTASDALKFTSTGTGAITLTGNASTQLTTTGTASVTLTGTANVTLVFVQTGTAALTLTGAASDVLKFAVIASATVTLTATASNSLTFTQTGTAALALLATASQALRYPATGAGAISLRAFAENTTLPDPAISHGRGLVVIVSTGLGGFQIVNGGGDKAFVVAVTAPEATLSMPGFSKAVVQ